jgi:hypothetical protein
MMWPTFPQFLAGKTLPDPPLDRLVRMKSKAILADLFCFPAMIDSRHKKGINVLYGHGGAKWVNRKALDNCVVPGAVTWRSIPFDTFSTAYNAGILTPATNTTPEQGVWAELDKQ